MEMYPIVAADLDNYKVLKQVVATKSQGLMNWFAKEGILDHTYAYFTPILLLCLMNTNLEVFIFALSAIQAYPNRDKGIIFREAFKLQDKRFYLALAERFKSDKYEFLPADIVTLIELDLMDIFEQRADNQDVRNSLSDRGANLVMVAVDLGSIQAVTILLTLGYDVNTRTIDGISALRTAVSMEAREMMRLLLTHGADPTEGDLQEHNEVPIIFRAISTGNIEVFNLLLDFNTNIHITDSDGLSVLNYMGMYDEETRETFVRIALERGCNINHKDYNDITPLEVSIALGDEFVMHDLLLKGADPAAARESLVHLAVEYNSIHCLQGLHQNGFDCNEKNRQGLQPIEVAYRMNFTYIFHMLLATDPSIFYDPQFSVKETFDLSTKVGPAVIRHFVKLCATGKYSRQQQVMEVVSQNPNYSKLFAKYNTALDLNRKIHIMGNTSLYEFLLMNEEEATELYKYVTVRSKLKTLKAMETEKPRPRYASYMFMKRNFVKKQYKLWKAKMEDIIPVFQDTPILDEITERIGHFATYKSKYQSKNTMSISN